jgi:hypothetical protein
MLIGARMSEPYFCHFDRQGEIFSRGSENHSELKSCQLGLERATRLSFFFTSPFLDFFFSGYSGHYIIGFFIIYQLADVVFFGKSLNQFLFMFVNTPYEIIGNANVNNFMVPIGEQVNKILSFKGHKISPAGRNNKKRISKLLQQAFWNIFS